MGMRVHLPYRVAVFFLSRAASSFMSIYSVVQAFLAVHGVPEKSMQLVGVAVLISEGLYSTISAFLYSSVQITKSTSSFDFLGSCETTLRQSYLH
jgi:hypothetical protein